jgi:hypothetical protein
MSEFIYNNAKEIIISVIFLISWITSWCFGYRFAAKNITKKDIKMVMVIENKLRIGAITKMFGEKYDNFISNLVSMYLIY